MHSPLQNWYILYTRPKFEEKVSEALAKKHIQFFCPAIQHDSKIIDNSKSFSHHPVLFSGYVFIHIPESQQQSALEITGVIGFVHWRGKPAEVSVEEIEGMRKMVDTYSSVTAEKMELSREGVASTHAVAYKVLDEGTVNERGVYRRELVLPSMGYVLYGQRRKRHSKHKSRIRLIVQNSYVKPLKDLYSAYFIK